jgi:hypothetical protein
MHARVLTATAHDLATFHTDRAAIYRVLAEIVGVPPTPRALRALHELLDEAKNTHSVPLRRLIDAIEGDCKKVVAEYFALVESEQGLPDVRCIDPKSSVRCDAFHTAIRRDDESALSDLLVLSHLAEQSARAIRQGDYTHAAELSHLQYRFLDEHGSTCLNRLAASLLESGFAPYAAAAHLLHRTIAEDLSLLDAGKGAHHVSDECR